MAKMKQKQKSEPRVTEQETSAAQMRAKKFRDAAEGRVLTVPEGTPEGTKVIHPFAAEADGYPVLYLNAEDESEAVRQFRICYGIEGSTVNVRVSYHGNDPRPKPAMLQAASNSPAAG